MATARCYTKSGSVNKYEPNLWRPPLSSNWSSSGIVGKITTPDSNGNYIVTPYPEYEDSNTPTGLCCYTMYGDVRKTFYFKRSIKEIFLTAGIGAQEETFIVVYLAFGNNEYLGNDKLDVEVQVTADNPTAFIDPIHFTVDKNSQPSLIKRIYRYINMNRMYSAKVISCSPMGGSNYKVTIRD